MHNTSASVMPTTWFSVMKWITMITTTSEVVFNFAGLLCPASQVTFHCQSSLYYSSSLSGWLPSPSPFTLCPSAAPDTPASQSLFPGPCLRGGSPPKGGLLQCCLKLPSTRSWWLLNLNLLPACLHPSCDHTEHNFLLQLIPVINKSLMWELTSSTFTGKLWNRLISCTFPAAYESNSSQMEI